MGRPPTAVGHASPAPSQIGNLTKFRIFAKTVQDILVSTLEHGDEGEDRVEESAGVGHQQLLVTHLQGRHK